MPVNVDNKTPRLDLPLPDATNFLQDDVGRLIETINDLDEKVALVAADGKLEPTQLPDNAAKVDANKILLENQLPAKVVVVDNQGKVPLARIPDAAMTGYKEASSDQSMQALNALAGDVCKRLDSGKFYFLSKSPASALDNWRELPPSAVYSVNGQTGAVTGIAKSGENSDITKLTGLQGAFALPADGAAPYDAVTVRQLQQVTAGQGATMNGVMNNFIGAVEWFNGSRTQLPAGYVVADGQVVSRTAESTRDLWGAVDKGMLVSMDEKSWVTDALGGVSNRAAYSRGGAAGTDSTGTTTDDWFRVPDLNGVQLNSIPNLFLMGWNGEKINSTYGIGAALMEGVPNLIGSFPGLIVGSFELAINSAVGGKGVFGATNKAGNAPDGTMKSWSPDVITTGVGNNPYGYTFNASAFNGAYGRYMDQGVRPNNAVGIWIIRASGAFQAANTDFRVITSDPAAPQNGTQLAGGKLTSFYNNGGNAGMEAQMWCQQNWGTAGASLVLSCSDNVANIRRWMSYTTAGQLGGVTQLYLDDQRGGGTHAVSAKGLAGSLNSAHSNNAFTVRGVWAPNAYVPFVGGYTGGTNGGYRTFTSFGTLPYDYTYPSACISITEGYDAGNTTVTRCFQFYVPADTNTPAIKYANDLGQGAVYVAWQPTSDIRLKGGVTNITGRESLRNIEAMRPVSFYFLEDKAQRVRRGFIAQELEKIDPEYVHKNDADGSGAGFLSLDSNPLLMDALAAIKVLASDITELKAQNRELKAQVMNLI